MSFGRPIMHGQTGHSPGFQGGQPDVLERMLDSRFHTLEGRILTAIKNNSQAAQVPQYNTEIFEILLRLEGKLDSLTRIESKLDSFTRIESKLDSFTRIESKLDSFTRIENKLDYIAQKNQAILDHLNSSESDPYNPQTIPLPPKIGINLKNNFQPAGSVLSLVKSIDLKMTDTNEKVVLLESKLENFKMLADKSLQEVYDKARDSRDNSNDAAQNTEKIISKMSKIQETISRLPTTNQLSQLDETLKSLSGPKLIRDDIPPLLRKTIEVLQSKPKRSMSKNNRSEDDSETRARSRSLSGDVASSGEKKSKKRKKSKKSRRSHSSSESSDEDEKDESDERVSFSDKHVSKIMGAVDDLESRVESFIKLTKKSSHKSAETTNCILQQLVTNNKALEIIQNKQSSMEKELSELCSSNNAVGESNTRIMETILASNEKVEKFGAVVEALQNDQNSHFNNLSSDIMNINDKTNKLTRIDDCNAKLKTLYKLEVAQDVVLARILVSLEQLAQKSPSSEPTTDSKSVKEIQTLVRELLPRMDDFYGKVWPQLEDLKKLQRQIADQDELQEKQNSVNLQKILMHLEDLGSKSGKPSDPRTLPTDTAILRVFSAINDMKNQCNIRDQTTLKALNELHNESQKATNRLNEILKTKATEKTLSKLATSIEEVRSNSSSDMKTLSTMNTTLQGMRTSSSAHDAKFASYLKEIRQVVTDNKAPLADLVTKTDSLIEAIANQEKSLEKQHTESLSDLEKQLAELIQKMPGKSEPIEGNVRVNYTNEASAGKDQEIIDEKLMGHINGILKEMSKISGISAEIMNSVEDLKQLTSTVPHTVHDLVPKIDKLSSDVTELPNEVLSYTAALEENLGKNIEKCIKEMFQTILQEILGKFDTMEQRMAVIKKYAKYGSNNRNNSTPTPSNSRLMDMEGDSQSKSSSTQEHCDSSPVISSGVFSNDDVGQACVNQVKNECKILGDSIANTLDQFIATADTTQVRQSIESLESRIASMIQEVIEIDQQILKQQVKSIDLEHQFKVINKSLYPLREVKPLQKQVIALVEREFRSLISEQKRTSPTMIKTQAEIGKVAASQQECLSLLTELKRFFFFASDDRLRDLLGANVDEAVKTLASSRLEERSVFQAEAVKNLIEFLKRIQATQQDILRNSDRAIEYQSSLNDALYKIVPVLEMIHHALEERKNRRLESGEISELCNELGVKITSLAELEHKMISLKQDRYTDDLRGLLQMCKNVMEQLSLEAIHHPDVVEDDGSNVEPMIEEIEEEVTKANDTQDVDIQNADEPQPTPSAKRRKNWGPKTKRMKTLEDFETSQDESEGTAAESVTDDNNSVDFEVPHNSTENSSPNKTRKNPEEILEKVETARGTEEENHMEKKAIVVKLVNDGNRITGRRESGQSLPDLQAKDTENNQMKLAKDFEGLSGHALSEDEARKLKKYQPTVLVEKIEKSLQKSESERHRDSSTESVRSIDFKKMKKSLE